MDEKYESFQAIILCNNGLYDTVTGIWLESGSRQRKKYTTSESALTLSFIASCLTQPITLLMECDIILILWNSGTKILGQRWIILIQTIYSQQKGNALWL